jgi:glycerol-3-phosphate dehydrogenase (NAD(P)+)
MKICVLGSGAFGLAIASLLSKNKNNEIIVWTSFKDEYEELSKLHTHKKIFADFSFEKLNFSMDLDSSIAKASVIILAVPSNAIREVLEKLKDKLSKQILIFVSKGLEKDTMKRSSEIAEELEISNHYGVLAGPTFAKDMLKEIPIGFTLATKEENVSNIVKEIFINTKVEIETTNDIVGVEYCGCIKNVLAVITGYFYTKEKSSSSRAAFFTKVAKEEARLLELLGGNKTTLYTFAGIGDLLLTATSNESRNFSYGEALANNLINDKLTTVEGKKTYQSLINLIPNEELKDSLLITYSYLFKEG